MQIENTTDLYSPSWIDRLTAWVRRLVLPAWVFYLSLGVALIFLALFILQVNRVPLEKTILAYYALTAFSLAYLPGLIHYLDEAAGAILDRFRSVMTVTDEQYELIRYCLTTLPARPALLASLLGAGYAMGALLFNLMAGVNPSNGSLPSGVIIMDIGYRVLHLWMAALLAYHTIHQLRMVSLIYTEYTRINLFQLGPLYALSNLAARTAIGISLPTYLWFWLNSFTSTGLPASDLVILMFFGAIIILTFVWPLLGAHQLLEREKQRLLDEVAGRIEKTIAALHERIDRDDLGEQRGVLKVTLDSLATEQILVKQLPTWPWRPGTVSGLGAVFLAPIIIWLIQRLLERLWI